MGRAVAVVAATLVVVAATLVVVAVGTWLWWRLLRKRVPFVASSPLEAARAFLAGDEDGFVSGFSSADLWARKARSRGEYRLRSARAIRALRRDELTRVNTALNSLPSALTADVVVLATDEAYEGGLPHTRGGFVFLPGDVLASPHLRGVLAHELVHVDQRRRPDAARQWALDHGYELTDLLIPGLRANPDLDGHVWARGGRAAGFAYASERPAGLRDGSLLPGNAYEHPYEHQAYVRAL